MLLNKLVLNANEDDKVLQCLKSKMNYKNVYVHLKLSKLFLCSSDQYAFEYIDSCLMAIYKTAEFLKLDIETLENILLRSSLLITSEIDVYHVAKEWIGHKMKKRGKFTKRLLQTIRLPLLSRNALKKILLINNLSFAKNKDFCLAINEILIETNFSKNKSSKTSTTRYCGHSSFDTLCFGGLKQRTVTTENRKSVVEAVDNKIQRINNSDGFNSSKLVSLLVEKRYKSKVVYLRGNFYIFGGTDGSEGNAGWFIDRIIQEVEVYSLLTKKCKVVADVEDANDRYLWRYAVCGFADKIYLLGGYDDDEADYCLEFDTKDCSWKYKSSMHEVREDPAACVFEEKIIVSGGMQYEDDDFVHVNLNDESNHRTINTVEAYDPIEDTWERLPSMNFTRVHHQSIAVRNKLFVIGGGTKMNEVYDSTSKRFTVLKPPLSLRDTSQYNTFASFSVGSKLFVYFNDLSSVLSYDVIKKKWSEETSEPMKHLTDFSANKAPRL